MLEAASSQIPWDSKGIQQGSSEVYITEGNNYVARSTFMQGHRIVTCRNAMMGISDPQEYRRLSDLLTMELSSDLPRPGVIADLLQSINKLKVFSIPDPIEVPKP